MKFKKKPEECQHEEFGAHVEVNRLTPKEGAPVTSFCAEIKVRCAECGTDFEFIGAPGGFSYSHPTSNADFTQLTAPIRPFTNSIHKTLEYEMGPKKPTDSKKVN